MTTLAPSATNSLAVASPIPLLPPVNNAVLFASRMAVSDGCIIKLDCLPRATGLILQPHKAVIDHAHSNQVGRFTRRKRVKQEFDGACHGETDQFGARRLPDRALAGCDRRLVVDF